MTVHVRAAVETDWPRLWPLLQGMGTTRDEESTLRRFGRFLGDPAWLIVVAEADSAAMSGYAAAQDTASTSAQATKVESLASTISAWTRLKGEAV